MTYSRFGRAPAIELTVPSRQRTSMSNELSAAVANVSAGWLPDR